MHVPSRFRMQYRLATLDDIPAMAAIRARDWGNEEYWRTRIEQYLGGEPRPHQSLAERVCYVCVDGEQVVGLIAGHLTQRFGCDGELQWVSVGVEYRGRGVASKLFEKLAAWFTENQAFKICVDVEPTNEAARHFYARHGAVVMKPHWMVWNDIRRSLPPAKL